MKPLIPLLNILFFLAAFQADADQLYHWIDATGKVYIGDETNKVPKPYRNQVKIYEIPSRPEKRPTAQKRVVSEPSREISENQVVPEVTAPASDTDRAEVRDLLQEKERLEQKRITQRIQQRRFGGYGAVSTGARGKFYQKRVEEIDEEIESVEEKLDEILSKNP